MQTSTSFQLDDFLAGWIGGASSVVVGHPLDTVKTRLQAGKGYSNTLHCVLTIYRKETVVGFFKGMSFPLASITVYNSVVFGFFSNTQRLISKYRYGDGRHPCGMLDLTVASMLTGLVSVGLGAPVDLVKIRLQMQTQTVLGENLHLAGNVSSGANIPLRAVGLSGQRLYRGPIHCISSILQTEGLPGLYRGAGAMILRDVPGYVLYFIPYTIFCNLLRPDAKSSPHPCSIWLAGGLAGFLPRGVGQRHSRLPDERHHVPDLRTLPAVLQESVGRRHADRRCGTTDWSVLAAVSLLPDLNTSAP
uniref:solute carrier family 25 member 48 isoform X2 n=1 Tax=Scatophagus argus TaxID=75038 RepID=UPI001ED8652D|nr:solute carrier family 25 member 48 isoform X2 [Scatophagus argus]